MRTIVVGVGNTILGDDGVGIHVVNNLKKKVKLPNVDFVEAPTGGLNLLDLIIGYDKAIIVDAITSKGPTDVIKLDLDDIKTAHSCNPHDVSFSEAIKLAEKLGENKIPKYIKIIGIKIGKIPCEFSECLSEDISDIIPKAMDIVLNEI
jgi:hydrogenase maturation protease